MTLKEDVSVLLNDWYAKALIACCLTAGLILLLIYPWPSGNNRTDSIGQEFQFEAEWGTPYESYFAPKYYLNIRNNSEINLNDVSVEATFYRDDATSFKEKIYQARWKSNDKIQFTVGPHNYQKETIKGTALLDDGSSVTLTGKWFLVPN